MRVTRRVENYVEQKVTEALKVPKPKELVKLEEIVTLTEKKWEEEYQAFKEKFIAKMEAKYPELKKTPRNEYSGRFWRADLSELALRYRDINNESLSKRWDIVNQICAELELGNYKGSIDEIVVKHCSK